MGDYNDLPCMQYVMESLDNLSVDTKNAGSGPKKNGSKKSMQKRSKTKRGGQSVSSLQTNIVQSISSSSNPLADIAALAMAGLSDPPDATEAKTPPRIITEINVADQRIEKKVEFTIPQDCVDLVEMLQSMFPDHSAELCVFVLQKCNKDIEDTVDYLLTNDAVEEFRIYKEKQTERETREEKTNEMIKKHVLARYDDSPNPVKGPLRPLPVVTNEQRGNKVLRYVDGQPVWLNASEKFIVEKEQEDPSTMVTIKIKRKGQGGPSPNFK